MKLIFIALISLYTMNSFAFDLVLDDGDVITIDDSVEVMEKDNFSSCDEEIPFCKLGQKIRSWTVRFHGITGDAFYEFSNESAARAKRKELIADGLCQ